MAQQTKNNFCVKLRYYLFLAITIVLSACATVPETGRRAFNFYPQQQLDAQAAEVFQQYKQQYTLSANQQWNQSLSTVAGKIVQAASSRADIPPANQWEFVVFEDDDVINAFAMPGGKVAVFSGMMKLVDNDDQLAVIVGHEVAHVAAKHSNERISQATLADAVVQSTNSNAVATALGLAILMPFSRQHESEADYIGLVYMTRAGYDANAAVTFWQKMQKVSGNETPPQFLSTHPSHETRIQRLRELIPVVQAEHG